MDSVEEEGTTVVPPMSQPGTLSPSRPEVEESLGNISNPPNDASSLPLHDQPAAFESFGKVFTPAELSFSDPSSEGSGRKKKLQDTYSVSPKESSVQTVPTVSAGLPDHMCPPFSPPSSSPEGTTSPHKRIRRATYSISPKSSLSATPGV